MKITKIQADNFLGINSISVRVTSPITLFCGPNGAGKSSLQEAIRVAFTQDHVRGVTLKKDFSKLVREGVKAGGALVAIEDGSGDAISYSFDMPSGTFSGDKEIPTALRIALDGQRFASMPPDERRTFLFGLTGCSAKPDAVRERMAKRECDEAKVEAVLPMLRNGFPAACEFARTKATEAKGAWRSVTGETYGAKKAETWKAEKPTGIEPDCTVIREALAKVDQELADLNQQQGALNAEARAAAGAAETRAALKDKVDSIPRIRENLELARKELAEFEPKVIGLRERAKGNPREGLVHDLARAIAELVNEKQPLGIDRPVYQNALVVLDQYENEHGAIELEAVPDPEAQASLPEHERGLTVLKNRVANLERDLAIAESAKDTFESLEPAGAAPRDFQAELTQIQTRITALKGSRDKLQADIRAAETLQRQFKEADDKTKKAAQQHADVLAWTTIADALAPDGIPGEILAEALEPINKTLKIAAADTGWMQVAIKADMSITAGGREYALLSESEQWRIDAMIAQTVSKVSGLKVLMLDRMDVLDNKGRVTLLTWLDQLADDGHIDTALLFATLKAMPSGLPPSITAHWIESGAVVEYKAAA